MSPARKKRAARRRTVRPGAGARRRTKTAGARKRAKAGARRKASSSRRSGTTARGRAKATSRRKAAGGTKRVKAAAPRRKAGSSGRRAKAAPARKRAASRPKAGAKRRAAAPRRAGSRRKGRVLRLVPAVRRRPPPRPAFPQREGASAKHLLVFDMMRARASVHAAVQGMLAATAETPMGESGWCVRETVLHLCYWDDEVARAIEAALAGRRPEWIDNTKEQDDRMNAEGLAALRHLGWDEALRLLHARRMELTELVDGVPAEPAEVWAEGHAFGELLRVLPRHDRHHADTIKRWRTREGV